MSKKDAIHTMTTLFSQAGFNLPTDIIEKFFLFSELLQKYNKSHDLSRIEHFEDIIIKHFIDSIYFSTMINIPSPLVDIGTGPGFPGIPLKIIRPDLKIILAEPRHKRVEFMHIVIQELGLKDIEIYPHLVTDKSFFEANGVITRALETIDTTLTRVNHFLPVNGEILFMKGPEADNDLKIMTKENNNYFILKNDISYTLPATSHHRRMIIFKKTAPLYKKSYTIMKNDETPGQVISSKENKTYKLLKKCAATDGIIKTGKLLVSGKKIITELIADKNTQLHELVLCDGYIENDPVFNAIIEEFINRGKCYILKKELYNEIDIIKTKGPLLAIGLPEIKEWDFSTVEGCTMLIPFQDPANVGSVIRSGMAFNVKQFILLKEAAYPYHPKSIRASAGAVFAATLLKGPSINELDIINQQTIPLICLDKNGLDITIFSFPESFLLLPGIEGPGLPSELKEHSIAIPLENNIESLNAAASVSIALYAWRSKK